MENKNLINKETSLKIKELTDKDWEFTLHFGDNTTWGSLDGISWEADFTRKKKNGLWDNHESGHSLDPNEAINKAYSNIKNGIRLHSQL